MQQFRQQYNFLNPDKEATRLSQQLTTTEQDYRAGQSRLNEINSRYQALQQQVGLAPNQAIIATYLSESPGYQDLLATVGSRSGTGKTIGSFCER
jgi:uncharacterized protein involved in exopolysaccharide biosynthesis